MFTIKVMRRGENGAERTHIYQTRSVTVHGPGEDWLKNGERAVIWEDAGGGGWPCVTVSNEEPTETSWPAHMVVIENAEGKTTEIVRPVGV